MAIAHSQKPTRVAHSSSANAQSATIPPVMLLCAHPSVRLASCQNDKEPVAPKRARAGFFVVQRRVNGVDHALQGKSAQRHGSKIQFSRG